MTAMRVLLGALAMLAAASTATADDAVVHPELWPEVAPSVAPDPAVESFVDGLLSRMTIEEKVGQIIQADISTIQPEDLGEFPVGSVLNGGGSGPGGVDSAPAPAWLALADAFYDAVKARGGTYVPLLWGTDAVHGHNNIVGATIFPHNIGLGATRDPALVEKIGAATALEVTVTGQDWTFAPVVAVVRDDRWGRTYESYSEDPEIVAEYATAIVSGLQGRPGTSDFLGQGRIVATAKHFIGDGGTDGGRDRGDNLATEEELRDIHAPGYIAALGAGVQTVMASFSSWQGGKMHGRRALLTDVLKGRFGFDGFVVGDWHGHAQLPGCSPASCADAINAGIDMFMAPDQWRELFANTLAQVKAGTIPMARLDDAVRRILRVKAKAGLFYAPRPSARPNAGRFERLRSPEHRALAREAVRRSLVLLKNDGGVLPLKPGRKILVVGAAADDIGRQCGGWTIGWQGSTFNGVFPNGQSILGGIREAVERAGGTVTFSELGRFEEKPDAAIVVFGEEPYAEIFGDVRSVAYGNPSRREVVYMRRLRNAGVPVVSVFLSGRPLWVNPELNESDAFVAAWLPGTEGGGIADVLFAKADGAAAYDFAGKLSFSWPRTPDQIANRGDAAYDPLFPYGYGLTYADRQEVGPLPE